MSQTPDSNSFDIGKLLGRSWEIFVKNVGAFASAMVAFLVIMIAVEYAGSRIFLPLASVLGALVCGPLLLGLNKMAVDGVHGRSVQLGTLFEGFSNLVHAALANLLISVFTTIGLALCVVPGILVAVIYLNTYILLATGTGDFWSAMEKSRKMAMDNLVPWLILGVVVFALNCAGAALCGLGLIVSAPVSAIMIVLAHEQQRDSGIVTPVTVSTDA